MNQNTLLLESPAQAPSTAQLIQRARDLMPMFRERCFEPEKLGRLPEANVEALIDSGLLRIGVPARFGGLDVDIDAMFECSVELARGCAATAWCFSLWNSHGWWSGYYSDEAQQELYGNGPDVLISSANLRQDARITRVPGGYRVSGTWMFSSGIDHASWVFIMGPADDGQLLNMMIPCADISIVPDSWQVSGLQGSGSKTFVIEDVFVPEHRVVDILQRLFGVSEEVYALNPQRRYTTPQGALQLWDLVSPAIGLAHAAVDEMVERLAGTSGRRSSGDSSLVQSRIAISSAEADAARTIMRADVAEAQDKGQSGEGVSDIDIARYNRNKAFAVRLSATAVNRLFDMSGGRALLRDDRMQLIHRDVQATLHRDKLLVDFGGQTYAKALLGMDFDLMES